MNNRFAADGCGNSISEESILNYSRLKAIVVFILDGQPFGIDINLAHGFLPAGPHTSVEDIHPGLSGFFCRTTAQGAGSALPLLNIAHLLGTNKPPSPETVIISELNQSLLAFSVDSIAGIYDLSSYNLSAGPQNSGPGLLFNGLKVLLPDFEALTGDVLQALTQKQKSVRRQKHILLVHNSALLREVLIAFLHDSGYINVTELDDYDKAYPYLLEKHAAGRRPDLLLIGSTGDPPLSDVQSLICTSKACLPLRFLPAILLTDQQDLARNAAINAQLSPFKFPGLIEHIDAFTGNYRIPSLKNLI
jgi:chemotaxis signal transduction protein